MVNMKQKQANAILYSHCVSSLACASIFRNQEKQNPPAFQEFFDQRFRYRGTKPLTKKPEDSENHTLPYTSPLNKPPHPQGNCCPELLLTQEPVPNSNKQTNRVWKTMTICRRIGPYCVRTASSQKRWHYKNFFNCFKIIKTEIRYNTVLALAQIMQFYWKKLSATQYSFRIGSHYATLLKKAFRNTKMTQKCPVKQKTIKVRAWFQWVKVNMFLLLLLITEKCDSCWTTRGSKWPASASSRKVTETCRADGCYKSWYLVCQLWDISSSNNL